MKKWLGLALLVACVLPAYAALKSGLAVGEAVTPFKPTHVAGPDKGSTTCPPCKYGNRPAVQVWFNNEDPKVVDDVIVALNRATTAHKAKELKTFAIFLSGKDISKLDDDDAVKLGYPLKCCPNCNCGKVGVAFLSSKDPAVAKYKVSLDKSVKNTVVVYKDKKVVANFVNLKTKEDLSKLNAAIAKAAK